MTRLEVVEELVKRSPGASAQDVVCALTSVGRLLEVLEILGLLGPHKDAVGLALCRGCNKLHGDWPDGWRWSRQHHGYVCLSCATKEEVTP